MTDKPAAKPRNIGNTVRGTGIFLAFAGLAAITAYAVKERNSHGAAMPSSPAPRAETHTVTGPATVPELKRVLLSTGGVGYFEYETRVTGTAELVVPVRMDQVDDVLKSIIVFDDKGNTGFVQLPSRAPLSDIFRGLPFGPQALESNAALIEALKGSEVTVRGPDSMSGRIAGINKEVVKSGDDTIIRHRVGVVTDYGLKQFVLEEATSVNFDDPVLANQIKQALAAVAEHRENQGRTLKIRANGTGSRNVTVAYVVEAPLWKSSYRVTALGKNKARLQGWAVLENMTGTDWKNVDLTVVTGNPVTFRQAIYATYYVTRPEVPVEIVGRIMPKPDDGSVSADADGAASPAPPPPPPAPAKAVPASRYAPADESAPPAQPMAAEAKESATQVTFHMPFTVTVNNGQSLAVPIIDSEVPGELVSYYQPETHETHPLAALKLTNSSGTGLPPGVLTLYDTASGQIDYIGDAQLKSFPVTESRLLGFALDQKVLIDADEKEDQQISKATIANGVFKASIVDIRTTVYTIKGAAKEDRKIVVEHPREDGWELVSPDPKTAEMTPDAFRIAFEVKAGTTIKETVTAQWARLEEQIILDLDPEIVLAYASNQNLTPAQRAAFNRIAEMKRTIADLQRQIEVEQAARNRVFQEQERIRENIRAVPAGSELQARYLRSMSQLEDQAEAHKRAIDRLEQQKAAEQKRLADYVAGLQL